MIPKDLCYNTMTINPYNFSQILGKNSMVQYLSRSMMLLRNILDQLDAGADGIIADTIKITNKERYKGKHALTVIRDVRYAINQYYAGKENDGTVLMVAGDFNNTGRIVKLLHWVQILLDTPPAC